MVSTLPARSPSSYSHILNGSLDLSLIGKFVVVFPLSFTLLLHNHKLSIWEFENNQNLKNLKLLGREKIQERENKKKKEVRDSKHRQ